MSNLKQNKGEEKADKLRRVLPFYESRADEPGVAELITQIELHLYEIEFITDEQFQKIIEPYAEQIEEQIEAEAETVTYLIQVKVNTNLQTGKIEDVWVSDTLNCCNYIDSTTVKDIGDAVADFLRDYHRIGEVNK